MICEKLVMLRTLFGSEFQTVGAANWKERSPADLRLTRGIVIYSLNLQFSTTDDVSLPVPGASSNHLAIMQRNLKGKLNKTLRKCMYQHRSASMPAVGTQPCVLI